MADTKPVETPTTTVPRLMARRDIVNIMIAGALVGLITLALYFLLDKYVFTPGFCANQMDIDPTRCENKEYFASSLAMIVSALGGLFVLVQQRVFRPLLVVLLVTAGLWDVLPLIASGQWWASALLSGVLFGVAYLAFAWLVQLRNFYLALGVSLAVIVVMRLILMS